MSIKKTVTILAVSAILASCSTNKYNCIDKNGKQKVMNPQWKFVQ